MAFGKDARSGSLNYLKQRAEQYGINTEHLYSNNRYTEQNLRNAAAQCDSFAGLCRHFGVQPSGYMQTWLIRLVRQHGVNTDHFKGQGWNLGQIAKNRQDAWTYLVLDGPKISSTRLKKKLIEAGLKEDKCEDCGLAEWLGKKLTIELDHVNECRRDCRLENLRFRCPNCHAIKTDEFNRHRHQAKPRPC